eukprot:1384191-Amphidinium_carterae.1
MHEQLTWSASSMPHTAPSSALLHCQVSGIVGRRRRPASTLRSAQLRSWLRALVHQPYEVYQFLLEVFQAHVLLLAPALCRLLDNLCHLRLYLGNLLTQLYLHLLCASVHLIL